MNKTKYVMAVVVIVLGSIMVFNGVVHDFRRTKTFYGTFFPNRYFVKDVFIFQSKKPGSNGSRGFYYYKGYLKENKDTLTIHNDENAMEKLMNPDLEVSVWFCTIDGAGAIVNRDDEYPKPYDYALLDSQIDLLLWILFIPSMIYIIRYQILKRKMNEEA